VVVPRGQEAKEKVKGLGVLQLLLGHAPN
jgi:hypothetical protein